MKRKIKQRIGQQRRHRRNIQAMIKTDKCPHGYDIASFAWLDISSQSNDLKQ